MKLTIIVTCFNEKVTILKAIEEAKNLNIEKEIIVIDNCSTDGSREILKALNDNSIKIVFQPQNYGYGRSVKTGISLAKGEFAYVQYSDLEYDIGSVHEMLNLAEKDNLDAVFGSRLYGIKKNLISVCRLVKERPYYLGTLATTFLINLFYGRRFTDIIGTRLYRASSFRKIDIESTGIAFDFEVVSKLCKKRFSIKEVPVCYKARSAREGKKVKAMDIIPALIAIFKVKFF
ncbi:MAG: glycosyltransferase family 2 protein [Candidatus Omnitrophota bacterium]|nr:glycosyltransferase family 2 protein [Candidatus Omnitrophota bacterium]